jgi:hypothetical protein
MRKFSLQQQVEEVERELRLRRDVYARLHTTKPSTRSENEFFMQRMEAVLRTLLYLIKHKDKIVDHIKEMEGNAPQ